MSLLGDAFNATAVGGLLGDGGLLGSKQKDTTSTVAPWVEQQPFLKDLFARAQGQLNSGNLAPVSPYTTQAANLAASSATDPNGLVAQGQNQLGATIGGQYLSPTSNPYLQGTVQQALDQVRQNVNAQFSGDNYGSSANQEFLTKTLANTALPIYAQNYSTERQNQLAAAGAAPQIQAANAQQLAGAGALQEQAMSSPYTALSRYQGLIGGGFGSQTTTPYFTNPLGSALGGATAGYAIGGPYGAAIGGGLGLLSARG